MDEISENFVGATSAPIKATLPEIKLALSSKSRDLLSHVISECMQMRGRIENRKTLVKKTNFFPFAKTSLLVP